MKKEEAAELEEIYCFLESLRIRHPPKKRPDDGKQHLELPNDVAEWFVPRKVENPKWALTTQDQHKRLYKYAKRLYDWKIPTFFIEHANWGAVRLMLEFKAKIKEEVLGGEEGRSERLEQIRHGFARHVAKAFAKVTAKRYGRPEGLFVAIFDASGESYATEGWEVSQRIAMVEITIASKELWWMKEVLVAELEAGWRKQVPTDYWATAIETGSSDGHTTDEPKQSPPTWASLVETRVDRGHEGQRLVFCDTAGAGDAVPEERPLRPLLPWYHAEMDASEPGDITVTLNSVDRANLEREPERYARLGSWWAPGETPSAPAPLLPARLARNPRPTEENGRGAWGNACTWTARETAAEPWKPVQGVPIGQNWKRYVTEDGKPYYHNEATQKTTWYHPLAPEHTTARGVPVGQIWKQYATEDGRPYYHNETTGVSTWINPLAPQHWIKYATEDGRLYYHNAATRVTTWIDPAAQQQWIQFP